MSTQYSPKIITDGLVFTIDAANTKSYTSGSTIVSSLINNYTGSFTNGTSYTSSNGGVFTFDGINDYITISNPQQLNPDVGSFSLEVWCKTNQQTIGNVALEARGTSLWGILLALDYPYGSKKITLFVNPNDQASQKTYSSTTAPAVTGSWQHIVTTLNRTTNTIFFYYNGIQTGNSATLSFTGSVDPGSSYRYWVGGDLGGNPMNGNIAISRQYNRALSSQEVLQNYNATKTRFGL
jgi:hypothetical protein